MKINMYLIVTFLIIVQVTIGRGYSKFKDLIPNGHNVPNPCDDNGVWKGVGHTNPMGNGPRNPFGEDFHNMGNMWASVCHHDSDGDGRTNGEELGDPNCNWTKESTPIITTGNLTHPGICEPLDNKTCTERNSWLKCSSKYTCNGTNEPDVDTITIRVTNESVPARETNYLCKVFDVPTNDSYDIVGAELIIDNTNVLHHMVLYGCDENDPRVRSPQSMFECFMTSQTGCRSMISAFAAWDSEVNAFCLPADVGVRIGVGGYRKVMIQYHWTNSDLSHDQTDSSGLKLYVTPALRPNIAGMLMVGQVHLEIPPGQERVSFSGGCVSDCSMHRIKKPVKVIETFNHMHYLGREQMVEVFRNGTKVYTLSNETNFDYNNPKFYRFKTPVELFPGDYIRTTCTYNSETQTDTVRFGLGTRDEMCFAFIRFYPLENLPLDEGGCSEWKSVPLCKIYTKLSYVINGCNIKAFLNTNNIDTNTLFTNAIQSCHPYNICTSDCHLVVKDMLQHPCLNNDIGDYLKSVVLPKTTEGKIIVRIMQSCSHDATISKVEDTTTIGDVIKRNSASARFTTVTICVDSLIILLYTAFVFK